MPPGQVQRAESKFIVFEQFEKMNTQSVRQALNEKELAWLENLQPIAPNNLTTVPAPAMSLSTISETISLQFYANIGAVDYIISFTTVGSAWATNIASGVSVRFATPGTFSNPDSTVWQSQRLLINDPTAGYSTWDGTTFVKQGGVSPVLTLTAPGSNYTSAPAVAITGGSGSGATATATIGTPAVIAVNVINGGSQYSPAPGVVFAGGGGVGAAATANIDPRGITSFTITFGGQYGSSSFPGISITGGGGVGASAAVTSMAFVHGFGWVVTGVSIVTPGAGYTTPPGVLFTGGTPLGAPATGSVTIGNGAVLSITVTSGGSGYTSAPSVSFSGGGGGSGASAAAVVGGSGVTSLTLTNPGAGYLASDVLTVNITGGGGTGATATAHVWPFVPKGTTIAVFGGRVWLNGTTPGGLFRLLQYTGTQGFDDFSATNASGSLILTDADLTHAITALRNYNNYLFIMGDQSVKQIGNISLNAAGNITLFTILTLSSDQGTIYPQSCGSFNRVFFFANTNGVYAVFGSSVQKVSDDMDGIFRLIDFGQEPQACICDINNIHHIAWLVRYQDPLANERSILLAFTGKKWFVINQGTGLTAVTTASTLASGRTLTFASSGQDITHILASPNIAVSFKLQTALTHHGNAVQRKKTLRGGFAATATANVSINLSMDTNEGSNSYTTAVPSGFQALTATEDGSGRYLGATVTGSLANFTMTNLTIEYQETNVGNK